MILTHVFIINIHLCELIVITYKQVARLGRYQWDSIVLRGSVKESGN